MPSVPCPCGSRQPYAACCGQYHQGTQPADARLLMRARYSAYTLGLEDYLLATWHPSTRPTHLRLAEEAQPQWLGLTVKRFEPVDPEHARVEFVARYRVAGRAYRLHEVSSFVRESGRWFYVEGQVSD